MNDLEKLERLADLMDSRFAIPGTAFRFGLDSLIGLVPGVGDTIGLLVSAYIYRHAHAHNVPRHIRWRMIANIVIDWLVGIVPVLGDLFDAGWKANRRNIDLMRRYRQP